MPNATPLSSVWILLGEHGYPYGHSTRGVFELGLGRIGQPRFRAVIGHIHDTILEVVPLRDRVYGSRRYEYPDDTWQQDRRTGE